MTRKPTGAQGTQSSTDHDCAAAQCFFDFFMTLPAKTLLLRLLLEGSPARTALRSRRFSLLQAVAQPGAPNPCLELRIQAKTSKSMPGLEKHANELPSIRKCIFKYCKLELLFSRILPPPGLLQNVAQPGAANPCQELQIHAWRQARKNTVSYKV